MRLTLFNKIGKLPTIKQYLTKINDQQLTDSKVFRYFNFRTKASTR